jgi:hypothetical protein
MTERPDLAVVVRELSLMTANLAGELWRHGLLAPTSANALGNCMELIAQALEDDDPTDPQGFDQAAQTLHLAANTIRSDVPPPA